MKDNSRAFKIVAAFVVVLCLLFAAASLIIGTANKRHVQTTVIGKERSCSRQECVYLVFTENGTFKVADSIFYRRFNSSDFYGKLKENQKYDFKVVGFRLGFASEYPNIIEATEIN